MTGMRALLNPGGGFLILQLALALMQVERLDEEQPDSMICSITNNSEEGKAHALILLQGWACQSAIVFFMAGIQPRYFTYKVPDLPISLKQYE